MIGYLFIFSRIGFDGEPKSHMFENLIIDYDSHISLKLKSTSIQTNFLDDLRKTGNLYQTV